VWLLIAPPASAEIVLQHLWTHNAAGEARAEIVAYDDLAQQFLVVNGAQQCVMRLDARTGREIGRFDLTTYGDPTCVAVSGGLAAVSVAAPQKTDPGHVLLYENVAMRSTAGRTVAPVAVVRVGALPDMVTFTPDGSRVLVACEGEPSDDYTVDPPGSVGIIDLRRGARRAAALTADFHFFNSSRRLLERDGVRLAGPNAQSAGGLATVAQDVEPEFIAVAPHGRTAWVTLQENNALAEVDLVSARITRIFGLGLKDHRRPGAGFDASDRDGSIQIRNWPVWGMYQPDGIAAFEVGGATYLITANEGDVREYAAFTDEARVADLALEPALLQADPDLQTDGRLGRLKVSGVGGDVDGDGDVDRLMSFGARSVAIWTTDGRLVYDSGDAIERHMAAYLPDRFNRDDSVENSVDHRSPVRGPEPEGIVVGRVGDALYAFVGLERTSAIAVFDITWPAGSRLAAIAPLDGAAADGGRNVAPEGLAFIPAERSWLGEPLLAVACEVSGTTVLFRVRQSR
jgi:DNA-binding beta-propeller fold protein YncE